MNKKQKFQFIGPIKKFQVIFFYFGAIRIQDVLFNDEKLLTKHFVKYRENFREGKKPIDLHRDKSRSILIKISSDIFSHDPFGITPFSAFVSTPEEIRQNAHDL